MHTYIAGTLLSLPLLSDSYSCRSQTVNNNNNSDNNNNNNTLLNNNNRDNSSKSRHLASSLLDGTGIILAGVDEKITVLIIRASDYF